jgi:two-component system, NarL family, invasion response regulator UvrY
VRMGLKGLLLTEFLDLQIEEAESEAAALSAANQGVWHLAILDVSLPGRGGLELIRILKGLQPHLKILIYTMHPERQFGMPAFRAGADGFLTKESSPSALFEAIRLLLGGRKYLSRGLAEQLAAALTGEQESSLHDKLSVQERSVFDRLVEGYTLSQIAADLRINIKTASTYRARVYDKLKLGNHSELMLYAVHHRLVRPSSEHTAGQRKPDVDGMDPAR